MHSILVLAYLVSCMAAKPTEHQRETVSPVQARDATCGTNGYDKGTPASFYISNTPTDVTSSGCASLCASTQGCVSFAYGGGNCLLYTAPVVGNINLSPDSPYVFNDLACVGGAATTSSPSSSSTIPIAASTGDAHASSTGDAQACVATTITVPGSQLPGATSTVTAPGTTVTQTASAAQVTAITTSTVTLPAGTVTQTLPAVTKSATVTQTLPATTATSTQTLPATTVTSTLTLPAVTKSATLTLPAVTSTKTVTATVTVRCAAFGILCTTST